MAIVIARSRILRPVGTITRPANTTPYSVGDVFGTAVDSVIAINNCTPINAGSGIIIGATVTTSTGTVTSKSFNLHVFTVTPTTPIADHAAFNLAWVDVPNYIGAIEGITMEAENATDASAHCTLAVDKLAFTCETGSKYLYVQPVCTGAFTPGSAEILSVMLKILQ